MKSKFYPHRALLIIVALVMHLPAFARADDLANLQGVWISEDFAWTVEFQESTAIFRGGNPFNTDITQDDVYPELRFRFTLDEKSTPRQLNLDEEDFAKFVKILKPYGSAAIKDYSKPFQGIYALAAGKDGKLPTEMQLEFYVHSRHWKTKGFNDQAFAHLHFVPTRKFRRLSERESELYRRLSGVWQGEILRDGKSLGPKMSFAILPGWVVTGPHLHARMPLTFDPAQNEFQLKQTSHPNNSPLAMLDIAGGEGNSVGLFGFSQPRHVTTNWQGTFNFAKDDLLEIEASPFPKQMLSPATEKMVDFDTLLKSDLVTELIANLENEIKNENPQSTETIKQKKRVLAEYQRVHKEGRQATMVTLQLTKFKQPPGEHPLTGLIRALNPDYASSEFLQGKWRLAEQALFDINKSNPQKQYNHYEPVAIADPETWVFEPGRLTINSQSGARHDVHVPYVELRYGVLRLQRQETDEQSSGYFQARIAGDKLVLTGRFYDHKNGKKYEGWKYTFERVESKQP